MEELFYPHEYAQFPLSLHQAMLADGYRLRVFERALVETVRPGDVVLDLGTGTGILAFLARRCGARRVYAVDVSRIIDTAREVKELNFPNDAITFIRTDGRSGRLPRVKVDVIVSELIGNFGIEENMIPIVARARDRLLKRGGRIVPDTLEMLASPVASPEAFRALSAWRRPRWGIDFSPFQEQAYNNVYHLSKESVRVLGRPGRLYSVDFHTVRRTPRRMSCEVEITRPGTMHGVASWFRARLGREQELSSDPRRRHTHWGQVFFPIGDPVRVRPGTRVRFRVGFTRGRDDVEWRWSGEIHPPRNGSTAPRRFEYAALSPL